MAKRQKKPLRLSPAALKTAAAFIAIVFLLFFLYRGYRALIFGSDTFTVKSIVFDQGLDFIDVSDVGYVKGKNIFSVDLKELQKRLGRKYPQTYYLSVMRRYPNQLYITAQQRQPYVQLTTGGHTFLIDDGGVVMSMAKENDRSLPMVEGARVRSGDVKLGRYCKSDQINAAILVVKAFLQVKDLSSYKIQTINVERLSQIEVILDNKLKVIVDTDNLRNKMAMLGVVLTEVHFDLGDTEYVDLRFKQPIRGKKNGKNVKQNKKSK